MIHVDANQMHRELTATSKHLALLGNIARQNGLPGVAHDLRTAEDAVDVARAGLHLRTGAGKDRSRPGVLDLGNGERASTGVYPQADGTFLAMTYTASKEFKTRAGAEKWLAKRRHGSGKRTARPSLSAELANLLRK